jgi:histidine triad (HIT) family protein
MCLFCQIIEKKLPARIVYEDSLALAFEDIHPKAPVHLLIIPKDHFTSLNDFDEEKGKVVGHLFGIACKLARERGIDHSGYRTVINTGRDAGQSVFHLHLHLLGGRLMHWPPG